MRFMLSILILLPLKAYSQGRTGVGTDLSPTPSPPISKLNPLAEQKFVTAVNKNGVKCKIDITPAKSYQDVFTIISIHKMLNQIENNFVLDEHLCKEERFDFELTPEVMCLLEGEPMLAIEEELNSDSLDKAKVKQAAEINFDQYKLLRELREKWKNEKER